MSNQRPFVGEYYTHVQLGYSHLLQHVATFFDAAAFGKGASVTTAFDANAALFISASCAGTEGVGCLPVTGVVALQDIGAALAIEPVDIILGLGSLALTAGSDYIGGYTTIINGKVRWGDATVHSSTSLRYGLIPELNYQTYINGEQLWYDFDGYRWFKGITMGEK